MDNINQIKLSNNIEFFARQVVEGFITGKHKSPYHGFSVEFAEHRLYNSGESTRHIDWKLFARSDKLFVKRFEEETNLRCQLILDTSSSMYYPNFDKITFDKPNKILFSVYASAVLMNIFKKQRDAVGISTFSDEIETHILAKSSNRHHQLIYHELENILSINTKLNNRKTSTVSALHEIADRINQRSLVFMFTDMISDDNDLEKIFDAIKHLKHKKHEIVLFYVSEVSSEHLLEFDNKPYNFIDVESGESIKLNPSHYKEDYLKRVGDFLDQLRLKCLQYKIDLVEVDINKGYDQIITSYLLKRQKMF
ncbi:MAG: DUF58 domain-containing protein [Flavobacteriales bacterium]|nr:DUF58 domain-containing protein [Flavobacteriales bacterium]|tara:strand:+ start:61 stop:987 length:927 start_codon:yes stop_codon:yes gene_type:complete